MTPVIAALDGTTTPAGALLVVALVLPVIATLGGIVGGGRRAELLMRLCAPAGLAIALAIVVGVGQADHVLVYIVGNWAPPLGLALRADGFSAAMLLTTAIVMCAVTLYAPQALRTSPEAPEARASYTFWVLTPALWAALNLVFLGGDLFNLYVALELLTFAAVPLACLDGGKPALTAAMRYLLFALIGSLLYLLGAGLIYGGYGTLDIALLGKSVRAEPVAYVAATLMMAGLVAKTALFPLHLWLPPVYTAAPPAVAAMLSGLVGKASFFLILRLWFNAMPGIFTPAASQFLAVLGTVAILFGGVMALRQDRLRWLIAYSSVAQVGYLFLLFPLTDGPAQPWTAAAWTGGLLQAISHALAKSSLFLAAGLILETLGHDRIRNMGGVGRRLPLSAIAIGLSGLSLLGVPPSGGFAAKWLLLRAAIASGQWWWALVVLAGGLLAGGYVFRMIMPVMALVPPGAQQDMPPIAAVSRPREIVVLCLALCSILLGLIPLGSFGFLAIGQPAMLEPGIK